MDYESLSDEQIRQRLIEAGFPVGPITDSTRAVYIRKLQRLNGELPEVRIEDQEGDDDEEEGAEELPPVPNQRPKTAKQRQPVTSIGGSGDGDVRQRRQQRKLDVPITKEVTETTGSSFLAFVVKAVLFVIIVLIVVYVVGLSEEDMPPKAISGSD